MPLATVARRDLFYASNPSPVAMRDLDLPEPLGEMYLFELGVRCPLDCELNILRFVGRVSPRISCHRDVLSLSVS
jgi:hypothetical protein